MTSEATPPYDTDGATPLKMLLMRTCELYAALCDALERTNPEADEYCLLLSNCADDLDAFISGMERLEEAGR